MHPIQFVPGTLSQCPTNSIPSLSMTSLGGGVTVLYSYVCSSLSVVLLLFKLKVTIGTKNHQYFKVSRSWNFCDFSSLVAARRSEHTRARSGSKSGKNRTCRRNFRASLVLRGMIFIFNFVSISISLCNCFFFWVSKNPVILLFCYFVWFSVCKQCFCLVTSWLLGYLYEL